MYSNLQPCTGATCTATFNPAQEQHLTLQKSNISALFIPTQKQHLILHKTNISATSNPTPKQQFNNLPLCIKGTCVAKTLHFPVNIILKYRVIRRVPFVLLLNQTKQAMTVIKNFWGVMIITLASNVQIAHAHQTEMFQRFAIPSEILW